MNALHEQFVAEARELIHQATDDLIAVEREGFAPERIDRVFRAFHTLKGSAGVVELPAMGLTMHAAEDLLAAVQAGQSVPLGADRPGAGMSGSSRAVGRRLRGPWRTARCGPARMRRQWPGGSGACCPRAASLKR